MPESSASAGSLACALAWRALASAFSTKVTCGSSASGMPSSACAITSIPSGASNRRNSRSLPALPDARTRRGSDCTDSRCAENRSRRNGGALLRDELADPALGQRKQRVHLASRERRAFGGSLHLDEPSRAGHHDVHVGVAA